jgi:WD40 repeat protein
MRFDDWPSASPALIGNHQRPLQQLAFHPFGGYVATVDVGGGVQMWSLSGRGSGPVRSWHGGPTACFDLRFDPSGDHLAAAYGDGTIRVWGLEDPPDAEALTLAGNRLGVYALAFHPNGRWLAAARHRGLGLYPFDPGRFGRVLEGHRAAIDDLVFAPDGSWLASASADGTFRLWPMARSTGERGRVLLELGPASTTAGVSTLAVAPGGRWLAVAPARGDGVRLVPLDGGPTELLLPGMEQGMKEVAVGPRGRLVAAGGVSHEHGHLIRVWDLETGENILLDVPEGQLVTSLELTAGGDLLSTGGQGLYRWDLQTRQCELLQRNLFNFALAPGGGRVLGAMLGEAGWPGLTATLLDLDTGALTPLPSHGRLSRRNTASYLALGPSGSIVVTVGDTELRAGPASGEAPHLLLGHDEAVHAVAVSPDRRWIASGSRDGVIRLWPMPEVARTPIHTLPRAELLARLNALVTLRCVPSQDAPGSYEVRRARFPGWEVVPTW